MPTHDQMILVIAVCLFPIAPSYGVARSQSVPWLLGIPVESTGAAHVFRAIMGLYLVNAAFWLAGAAIPTLRVPALWVLLLFMAELAAGRVLSLVVDGYPGPALTFYLIAELVLAALAVYALRKAP